MLRTIAVARVSDAEGLKDNYMHLCRWKQREHWWRTTVEATSLRKPSLLMIQVRFLRVTCALCEGFTQRLMTRRTSFSMFCQFFGKASDLSEALCGYLTPGIHCRGHRGHSSRGASEGADRTQAAARLSEGKAHVDRVRQRTSPDVSFWCALDSVPA